MRQVPRESDSSSNLGINLNISQNSDFGQSRIHAQMLEVERQKEKLVELQKEKEKIEALIQNDAAEQESGTEAVSQAGEQPPDDEIFVLMCEKAVIIQKWVRGMIARKFFEAHREEYERNAKANLQKQLKELSSIVKRCGAENRLTIPIAAAKIQAAW